MELSRVHRAVISRAALAVLGGGLLFGGYKCMRAAAWMTADYFNRMPPGSRTGDTGSGPFFLVGVVLLLLGGVFALAAITPTAVFARIMGPPRRTTLWESPNVPYLGPRRWWL